MSRFQKNENADYNASQNIAIDGIEEIIKSAQSKA